MRISLMAGAAVLALSANAYAWDTTTPVPSPTTNVTNSPMGGSSTSRSHSSSSATSASSSSSSLSHSGNSRVTVNVDPASGDPAADPAGNGAWRGRGGRGGHGGTNEPPAFGLPSFDAGQCSTVGFGIAISPSGGGAFGPAWESTNCRNYYIALELIQIGKVDQGVELLSMITPEAKKVLTATPVSAPAPAPVATRPDYCTRPGWTDAQINARYKECR